LLYFFCIFLCALQINLTQNATQIRSWGLGGAQVAQSGARLKIKIYINYLAISDSSRKASGTGSGRKTTAIRWAVKDFFRPWQTSVFWGDEMASDDAWRVGTQSIPYLLTFIWQKWSSRATIRHFIRCLKGPSPDSQTFWMMSVCHFAAQTM